MPFAPDTNLDRHIQGFDPLLPDESWLSKEIAQKIEIQHLLTHSSGLGSYFNRRYRQTSNNIHRALDDYKPLINNETLAFKPGTDNRYSNTGMFMLGVVIEKVTGQDYFSYIREHIYKPAGMKSTDSFEMDQPVPNLAIGYDANSQVSGVAISRGESGFQDVVQIIFGFDPSNGKLSGMKVLDSKETPGLGDKIFKDMAFVDQFFAGPETPLVGVKIGAGKGKPNEIDTITGATISSKVVISIINHGLEEWNPIIEKGIPDEEVKP